MTISELLDKTMTRDPNNSNIISFDGSKLDEHEEEESICIHCLLAEQNDRIENLEADIYDLQSKLGSLLKVLSLHKSKGFK